MNSLPCGLRHLAHPPDSPGNSIDALSDAEQNSRSHPEFLQRACLPTRLAGDASAASNASSRRPTSGEAAAVAEHLRLELQPPPSPACRSKLLAQGDFIRRQQNVAFVGQSGLGKSRLIQSIGLAACMLEQRVYYITSGELLEDLTAALAD